MATAAFRSSTRRSTFVDDAAGDASSSNHGATVCRSRSLSRYSDRLPPPLAGLEQKESPRLGIRPSNNSSGFVFPEISLDDLAHEFFLGRYKEVDITEADVHRRRGRSVSRCAEPKAAGEGNTLLENGRKNRGTSFSRLRRQRSVSMARQRFSDSEDFSSTLADDEVRNALRTNISEKINGTESASGKKKNFKSNGHRSGLREAMTNEERHTVKEIQNELEQSDKRKEILLAKLAVEQQRNQELSKIVKNLIPGQKSACMARTHSCVRRRSKDKLRMSKRLMDEAEKHIDEFLSNIEDSDISSFDGDRSDTSSTIGGYSKFRDSVAYNAIEEMHENPVSPKASPVESEGILLPWLHLETSNEGSSSSCKDKSSLTMNSESGLISVESEDFTRGQLNDSPHGDPSYFASSRDIRGIKSGKFELASEKSTSSPCNSSFFMDELNYQSFNEDIVIARYLHRQRIESGSLLICGRSVL